MPEESGVPKRIETVISNVFLFDKNVYKIYKNDNEFFNKSFRNLGDKDERFGFSRKDFAWNNALSPSIYLELRGVTVVNEEVEFIAPTDDAEELVIVMACVNTSEMVFDKLLQSQISKEDAYAIGKQLAENLQKVRTEKPTGNFYDIFADEVGDVRSWVADIREHKDELLDYCNFLEKFRVENREWFEGALSDELAFAGDVHSHNALYTNGKLFLMDTYAPKDAWLVAHSLIPIYRMGADLWALGNKEIFEAYIKGYEEGSGQKIDRRLDVPFVLYASSIMVAYLYMLVKANPAMKETATRYHEFARSFYQSVSQQNRN